MPRRLFAVVAVGAVSLVALAGCRLENPNDVAYVGNTRHRNADVDTIVDSVTADGANITDAQRRPLRQRIVSDLVILDVAKRLVAEKKLPAPAADPDAVGSSVGLPASDRFVQLEAQVQAHVNLLAKNVTPAKLTDADYHDAFNVLLQQGAVQKGSEAAVTQELKQFSDQLAGAVALRNELDGAMKRYNTSINPAVLPTAFPLLEAPASNGGSVTLVQLSLGGSATAAPVLDLPTPEATFAPEPTP